VIHWREKWDMSTINAKIKGVDFNKSMIIHVHVISTILIYAQNSLPFLLKWTLLLEELNPCMWNMIVHLLPIGMKHCMKSFACLKSALRIMLTFPNLLSSFYDLMVVQVLMLKVCHVYTISWHQFVWVRIVLYAMCWSENVYQINLMVYWECCLEGVPWHNKVVATL